MPATSFPQVGDFGDYRIDSEIGRGGMGVVYRAWQRRMNRPVALKVLPADLAQDPSYRSRIGREAAALAQLDSPHVIQIYDHGEFDGNLYLAMQLVQGPDLGQVIATGPLPPRRALMIAAQVAAALGDGHAVGVVHRDVKPSNILMRPRADHDDEDFVYLCDFGIARSAADVGAPETAGIIGTLAYLAPERLDGQPATPASDVYALGCLLWALLTGSPPFEGSHPQMIMGHVHGPVPQLDATDPRTRQLNVLLAGTMAKDTARRPTIAAVRQDIRRILATPGGDGNPPRRPPPRVPDQGAPRPTRRTWLIGAALLVASAAGGVAIWTLLSDPAGSADDRLRRSAPVGITCLPTAVAGDAAENGVLGQLVCDAGADVGELRLVALSGSGSVDTYLRTQAGQDRAALLDGTCPADLPARQGWERDGRSGTLLCFVLGQNTRFAWTFDDLDVVAVLDGRPQVPFPRDLEPVAEVFARTRYG